MTVTSCDVPDQDLWEWVEEGRAPDAPLREHLDGCPGCRARVAEMERLEVGLESLGRAEPARVPEAIGPYRVLRRIAEGGMGVVYEAEQTEPERHVAIKVLHARGEADRSMLRALAREARVLARLTHPNIATILDAGSTDDGKPYLVMQYVDGRALDRHCERHATPLRERVELVACVARAVHYAHQRGVLHCDLKPANVLVDPEGVPLVVDFGLARPIVEERGWTLSLPAAGVLGTLPYMSPEQARSDTALIDVRTDVYALGVMLYELCTGRAPYEVATGLHEAVRTILEDAPPHPSTVRRDVPRELGDVIQKALEKDPERRYASAEALAEDLGRFLEGEAVAARRSSAAYRLRVFARRNKTLVGAASVLLAVLFAGIVTTTLARREAEQRRDEAWAAVDLLTDALSFSDPDAVHGREPSLEAALASVAARLDGASAFAPDSLAAAELHFTIGRIYRNLFWSQGNTGDERRARRHLAAALEIRTAKLGELHPDSVEAAYELSTVDPDGDDFAEGILEAYRAGRVPPCRGVAMSMLGLSSRCPVDEREGLAREALEMLRAFGGHEPDVLLGLKRLAQIGFERGDPAAGERDFAEYLAAWRAAGRDSPGDLARITFDPGDRIRPGPDGRLELWDDDDPERSVLPEGGCRVRCYGDTLELETYWRGERNCGSPRWLTFDLRPRAGDPDPMEGGPDLDRRVYPGTFFAPPVDPEPGIDNVHARVQVQGLFVDATDGRTPQVELTIELKVAPDGCSWPPAYCRLRWVEPLHVLTTDDPEERVLTTRHPSDRALDAEVVEVFHRGEVLGTYRIPLTWHVRRVGASGG